MEIGSQPQSVIRQNVLDWMKTMTHSILDLVALYNNDELPNLPATYEAYKYVESITLSQDEHGKRIGMVYKNVQDSDFKSLNKSDPIFTLFDDGEINYQGNYEAYLHFINEAAY